MKIHKINLENNYRNLVDSAIAVKAGLTPAVFAARPTYNDVLLGFNDGETPTLLLPKWAQFTIDLSKNKPSWAPASLTGTLTVTITPSVVGVAAEEDEVTLGNADVYGVSVASTGKQYKVNEGKYTIEYAVSILDGEDNPVVVFSNGQAFKVSLVKDADNGPDTTLDIASGGGSFTQEQADWNQSDDTKVDYIKNKPTIPAVQDLLVEKTWSELKAMRDGGTLVPGQQYRITDYVATTVQSQTQSANKPFDIIVTADSASKLNEVARAILHSGDTNFSNRKMEAWKLWYRLDNDTTKFAWADSTNGKGVIYRMIDEYNNDFPYDFVGIKVLVGGSYVFSIKEDATSCFNNTVKPRNVEGHFEINRMSLDYQCSANFFAEDCRDNKLGYGCKRNVFGAQCTGNVLTGNNTDNTFGQSCRNNTLNGQTYQAGNGCNNCTFGPGCDNNTLTYGNYIEFAPRSNRVRATFGYNLSMSNAGRNIKICGCTTLTGITITDTSTYAQEYQTTYFMEKDGTLTKIEGSGLAAVNQALNQVVNG